MLMIFFNCVNILLVVVLVRLPGSVSLVPCCWLKLHTNKVAYQKSAFICFRLHVFLKFGGHLQIHMNIEVVFHLIKN